jgi:hypothetical protein
MRERPTRDAPGHAKAGEYHRVAVRYREMAARYGELADSAR